MLRAGPTPSPIVRVLNREVGRYHRWCTPSILESQERVEDFYSSDVSISAGFFGTLIDHNGIFGEAERFAAAAQGADRTMFSTHGSSGSNFVVLRALALERPDALVLVARNIHHSIINALKAFGLDFRFLPTPYDARFEAVLPPSVDDVLVALARYPEALAVIYTSPTYEGLAAHTREISEAVHATSEHAIVFVDEAWGGHLHFHPDLPMSAMDAGADVCVQSSHKLAGGLQQTGLIHWREGRVDSELMEESYREYVTTSPSYHLLASADAAVRSLAADGRGGARALDRTHARAARPARASCSPRSSTSRSRTGDWADARRRLRPGQDDARALALRHLGLRGRRGAGRAPHRHREGRHQHDHADHDVPARRRGGGGDRRRARRDPERPRAVPRAGASRSPPTRSPRSTTGR